jgi:hypothetical protein
VANIQQRIASRFALLQMLQEAFKQLEWGWPGVLLKRPATIH